MKLLYGSLVFCAVSLITLINGSAVNASSVYDGIVETTENITTKCIVNGSNETNWNITWANFMLETDQINGSGNPQYILDARSLYNSLTNSGWAVIQADTNTVGIIIYDPEEVTPEFVTDPTDDMAPNIPQLRFTGAVDGDNFYTLDIRDYGQFGFSCGEYQLMTGANYSGIVDGQGIKFFLLADDVEYPAGYEGHTIPGSIFDVNLKAYYAWNDRTISFRDETKYEDVDRCWVQMPRNRFGDNFMEYEYDCNSPETIVHTLGIEGEMFQYETISIIQFAMRGAEIVSKTYYIDIDGGIGDSVTGSLDAENIFAECMNSEFPFLHIKDCMKNLGTIGSLLSFNRFTFGSGWNFSNECRDLEVLDDWLNLSNNRVCPMVDMTIRNTITPFVTFAFGLMAITFISKKSGGGFD